MGNFTEPKRQRVSKACEQCRKKKVKCDGTLPFCNNCNSLGIKCNYNESTKKRGPPKGYIEAIEGRLHRLEGLLGNIIKEDDPRSQEILRELNSPLETAHGQVIQPKLNRELKKKESEHSLLHTQPAYIPTNDYSHNIDESGQLCYYGKSSGLYMLRGIKNFQDESLNFNSKNNTPTLLNVDPLEMPPKDLSDHLLSLYFEKFYLLLPLVHKASFIQAFNQMKVPPLLLNSMFALASRVSSDHRVRTDQTKPETAGDLFFERARILLDLEWDSFKLYTVQSLLLMSSHQNGVLKTTRGWLYSGMAIRMSQNLGLHRNCDDWEITLVEKEERKRVFYCCFVIDRLTSAMNGRSPIIDDRDYDTPLPLVSDQYMDSSHVMENFYYLIQICMILGEVIRDLYMVKGQHNLSLMPTSDRIVSLLDKKLNRWMSQLPTRLQYQPPNTRLNEKATAPSIEICQLHMAFYTTLILTHRPFVPGHEQTGLTSVFPSASICTFAANKISDITESLLNESRLTDVNSHALFFMFTAGIVFIYNAGSPDSLFSLEAKISVNKIMRAMDQVEKTWMTSARHCNILGVLAGLREIDLSCVDEKYTASKHKNSMSIAVPQSPEPDSQHMEEKYYMESSSSDLSFQSPQTARNDHALSFDPNIKEFCEIPMSFNIEEWSKYFGHQKNTVSVEAALLRSELIPNAYETSLNYL